MKAQRIILMAALVTIGSTVGASIMPEDKCGRGQFPSPRLLFGSALAFAGLTIAGDFVPRIAAPIAASIAITSLTYYGLPVLDAYFTDKPCKPTNNGRTNVNTLPASGAGTGGDFPAVIPTGANPGTGNRAAIPTF